LGFEPSLLQLLIHFHLSNSVDSTIKNSPHTEDSSPIIDPDESHVTEEVEEQELETPEDADASLYVALLSPSPPGLHPTILID
jgi:hypothetical protein